MVAGPKQRIPNVVLRQIREEERHETRDEFAQAVVDAAEVYVRCDARLVARWEDGEVKLPRPAYRRALEKVTGRSFDQLGFSTQPQTATHHGNAIQMPSAEQPVPLPAGPIMETDTELTLPLAGSEGMAEGNDDDDTVYIACREPDGRIIWMPLPRRTFLLSGLGATAAVIAGSPGISARPAAATLSTEHIQHFRRVRGILADDDNLFGPSRVIGAVQQQITTIQHVRQTWRSTPSERRELLAIQTQYADLCGWLYQDSGSHANAGYWLDRALEWAHLTGDNEVAAFILARKSQLLADMHSPIDALDAAEAAAHMARPGERTGVIAAIHIAHAHALAGDTTESQRAYDHARDLLKRLDSDPGFPYGMFLDAAYLEVHQAHSLTALGEHSSAADRFAQAVINLPDGFHRDRGVYLAREALAHARNQEPEVAATVGAQALEIGAATGSARISAELHQLAQTLAPWDKSSSISEFRASLRDRLSA